SAVEGTAMKPIMFLLSASLVAIASGAWAQGRGGDACSPQYGSCMDRCFTRPQSKQESCAEMCETNTNQCYQGLFGRSPQNGEVSSQASGDTGSDSEARAARDQAKPAGKPKRH